MKTTMYVRYPARSLAREGQRGLLAVLCISIGVLAIVALQLIANMVDTSLTGNIRALNGGDLDLSSPRITTDQLSIFDQLQAQGQITAYTAVSTDQGSAQGQHPVARIDSIRAIDPAAFPLAGTPTFDAPANATLATALTGTSVVLTADLAQQLGVHAGDTMTLTLTDGRPAQVTVGGIAHNTGLFQPPQVLLARGTFAALRNATAPPLWYDEVYADVPGHSATNQSAVRQQLHARFPDGQIITADALLRSNQEEVRSIRSFLQVVALVTVLMGGMGIVNTMQVLLRRRTTEIAMLKTAGFARRDLYALFGVEAALIGLAGGAIGAAAGVGASFLVKGVVERAFSLALTATIDPVTVGGGIAVGCATALIFGLLPIVRASQVRPLAVMRELTDERVSMVSRLTGGLLLLVPVALFFLLAFVILQDATTAAELEGGAVLALAVLGGLFALVIAAVSRLPVAIALPRSWKTHAKLALRNFGRQRARTATTEVALFTGVFAVGLILVLGQGLRAQYSQPSNAIDASVGVVQLAQAPTVANRLRHTAGVTRVEQFSDTGVQFTALNGAALQSASPFANKGKVEGYDLANGQVPTPPDITLDSGRLLGPSDAGTNNAVVIRENTDPSLNLRLGDHLAVQYTTKFNGTPPNSPSATLTIVGFATDNTLFADRAGNILADTSVVTALAGSNAAADILIHADPQQADAVLEQMLSTFPGQVFVHNFADVVALEQALFTNLILALEVLVLPALLAALIVVANTVALAMLERRRELGILKAVGHTSRGVVAEVVIEQGAAGLTAALLAVLIAVLVAAALSATLAKTSVGVTIGLSLPLAAAVVAGGTVVCMLVATSVAWGATRVRPLAVLRYE
jgi:predicted lysophospholipase L1 biosynthesis ABC-type transport system permease subunit